MIQQEEVLGVEGQKNENNVTVCEISDGEKRGISPEVMRAHMLFVELKIHYYQRRHLNLVRK